MSSKLPFSVRGAAPTADARGCSRRENPIRFSSATKTCAFTLLEILLVLVLVGLIGGVLAAGVGHVFSNEHPAPEDVFWQACHSAQKLASFSERETSLSFDRKEKKLVWSNGLETGTASFDATGSEVSVQFLQAVKGGSLILIAGQVVETQEVPRVMFYPDGTCTAFRVQFRAGANTWQLAIDPWTCAQVLEKTEANP